MALAVDTVHECDAVFLLIAVAFGPDAQEKSEKTLMEVVSVCDLWEQHTAWWKQFAESCDFAAEKESMSTFWKLQHYLLASTCREDAPPVGLQGVWSNGDGRLPPWFGDYHNNANVQFTYAPCLTANRLEQSKNLCDALTGWQPRYLEFAHSFFGQSGLCAPGFHTLDGRAFPGWNTVLAGRFHGVWLAKQLVDHYRFTGDTIFLKKEVWPFLDGLIEFALPHLQEDADGLLHLENGTSPEFNDNLPEAYDSDCTYELTLVRWLFDAFVEFSKELGKSSARVSMAKSALPRVVANPIGTFKNWARTELPVIALSRNHVLDASHRHHSHLMGLYPFDDLLRSDDEDSWTRVHNSITQIEALGTGNWVGFSFPWMACIAARLGRAPMVDHYLSLFINHFTADNGLNRNGDFRCAGVSSLQFDVMTLEANFLAAAAIQEACLQSWGGMIRLFSAVDPNLWGRVDFTNWRAEGGFIVSASLAKDGLITAEISSTADATLRVASCPLASPSGSRPSMNPAMCIDTRAGQKFAVTFRSDSPIIFREM